MPFAQLARSATRVVSSSARLTAPHLARRAFFHTSLPSAFAQASTGTFKIGEGFNVSFQSTPTVFSAEEGGRALSTDDKYVPVDQRTIYHHAMLPGEIATILTTLDEDGPLTMTGFDSLQERCEHGGIDKYDVQMLAHFKEYAYELKNDQNISEPLEYLKDALFGEGIHRSAGTYELWAEVEDMSGETWDQVRRNYEDPEETLQDQIAFITGRDEQALNGQSAAMESIVGSEEEVESSFPHDSQLDSSIDTVTFEEGDVTLQLEGQPSSNTVGVMRTSTSDNGTKVQAYSVPAPSYAIATEAAEEVGDGELEVVVSSPNPFKIRTHLGEVLSSPLGEEGEHRVVLKKSGKAYPVTIGFVEEKVDEDEE